MSKVCETGDRGQRYEHRCDDGEGNEIAIGWSDNPYTFSRTVELHPCWFNHKTIDRGCGEIKDKIDVIN